MFGFEAIEDRREPTGVRMQNYEGAMKHTLRDTMQGPRGAYVSKLFEKVA